MSFELHIEFVGLCLFVPVREPAAMHVLMPAAGHHHGDHDVPPHLGMLLFDEALLRPGADGPSHRVKREPMERVTLALAGRAPNLTLSDEVVVDVGKVVKKPIDERVLWGSDPDGKLVARLRLGSGAWTGNARGACWNYELVSPARRELPNRLYWTMNMDAHELVLELEALENGTGRTLPPLYPIGGEIHLKVYNTPLNEIPPDVVDIPPPPWGTRAHHFGAYYRLFNPPFASDVLPTFEAVSCTEPKKDGGSPYTCMVAQSPPAPPAPGL